MFNPATYLERELLLNGISRDEVVIESIDVDGTPHLAIEPDFGNAREFARIRYAFIISNPIFKQVDGEGPSTTRVPTDRLEAALSHCYQVEELPVAGLESLFSLLGIPERTHDITLEGGYPREDDSSASLLVEITPTVLADGTPTIPDCLEPITSREGFTRTDRWCWRITVERARELVRDHLEPDDGGPTGDSRQSRPTA